MIQILRLSVLPSGGLSVLGDEEREIDAGVASRSSGRSSVGFGADKVSTVSTLTVQSTSLEVLELVLEGSGRDVEASSIRAGTNVGRVSYSVAEETVRVDINLLATRNLNVEGEGAIATGEDSFGLVVGTDIRGCVGFGATVEVEVGTVGVDVGVLDIRTRVECNSRPSLRWSVDVACWSSKGRKGNSQGGKDGGGLHIDGFVVEGCFFLIEVLVVGLNLDDGNVLSKAVNQDTYTAMGLFVLLLVSCA